MITHNHSVKFGGEYRPEEFTIFQPAAPRGTLTFAPQFTDTTGAEGTGVPGTLFNTCAFVDPPLGSFGNVSLNSVNVPGNDNWDSSILKTIPIHEAMRVELRGQFYNISNHRNFLFAAAGPQNSNNAPASGSSNFGDVTAARDPRQIQIGAKLYF